MNKKIIGIFITMLFVISGFNTEFIKSREIRSYETTINEENINTDFSLCTKENKFRNDINYSLETISLNDNKLNYNSESNDGWRWIHNGAAHDNNEANVGIALEEPGTAGIACVLDLSEDIGKYISKVSFCEWGCDDSDGLNGRAKIYIGDYMNPSGSSLIDTTFTTNGFIGYHDIDISNVLISYPGVYWIVIEIDQTDGEQCVVSMDSGPMVYGGGYLEANYGGWSTTKSLGLNNNTIIEVYVETIEDITPPVTTALYNSETREVTLDAYDPPNPPEPVSGVCNTYFKVDDGATQIYSTPFTLSEGIYTITYWSVDCAGNEEYPNIDTFGDEEEKLITTGYENWYTYVGDANINVNVANGNLFIFENDLSLNTLFNTFNYCTNNKDICEECEEEKLSVDRCYNSQFTYDPPFGIAWTYNHNVYLNEDDADGSISLYDGDGSIHEFKRTGDTYNPPPGIHSSMIKNDNGTFTIIDKYGIQSNFNDDGKRSSIEDNNGNRITIIHDNSDKLISVIDDAANSINFEYDSSDRIIEVEDQTGRKVNYEYNPSGYLSKVTDPLGNSKVYTYNDYNLLESITDVNGKKTVITYKFDNELPVVSSITYETSEEQIIGYFYNYNFSSKVTYVTDANEHITKYKYNGNGNVIEITDPYDFVEVTQWDADMNEIAKIDKNTNKYIYDYDEFGNVIKIINPLDQVSTFTYEPVFNRLKSETDANGHTTTYEFDELGNRIKINDAESNSESFEYDNNGNMIRYTDKNGHVTIYDHDQNGNVIRIISALGNKTEYEYDEVGNLITTIDANNHKTEYQYDSLNRLIKVTDALNNVNEYLYDSVGNIKTTIDPKGSKTNYFYDKLNRKTKITDPLSFETNYEYDSVGNLIKEIDAKGNYIEYKYDNLNRMIRVIKPFETKKSIDNKWIMFLSAIADFLDDHLFLKKYLEGRHSLISKLLLNYYNPLPYGEDYSIQEFELDPVGNILAKIDPDRYRTEYEYNNLNQLVKIINPEKESTIFTYDNVGNIKTIQNTNGNLITYTYDNNDRLIELSDKIGLLYTNVYDSVGNLLKQTDANSNSITFEYDEVNRLTNITDPLGESIYNLYDPVGNLITVYDKNSNPTSYVYDAVNKKIFTIDALNYSTSYEYDCCNLIEITDANGHETSYQYDLLNRLILETYADGTTKEYSYDEVGNVISLKDQLGHITNYEYDDLYRLKKRDYPDDNDDLFTYGKASRMLSCRNKNSVITFEYDKTGRIIKTNQNDYQIEYEYDVSSNERIINYPVYIKSKNTGISTFFDSKKIIETRDERNRLSDVEVMGEGIIIHYEYDNANRLLSKTYSNDIVTSYEYNNNDWVTSIIHNKGLAVLAGFRYEYGKEGNRKIAENLLPFNQNKVYTYSEKYDYDAIYQLIDFKKGEIINGDIPTPIETSSWSIDPIGNWNQFTINGVTYKNTPNQMNEYDDPSTDGPAPVPDDDGIPDDFKDPIDTPTSDGFNFCHDKNGNLIDDDTNIYEYDYSNNLISVTRKSDNKILEKYYYDPLGRRIQKDADDDTVFYLYDGYQVIEEHTDGIINMQFVYGEEVDEVLAMYKNSDAYYYHTNPLGSILLITDVSGGVVERYSYDSYGQTNIMDNEGIIQKNSSIDNPYMFTGRRLDGETGLYYYRARYYNPSVGRFINRDPVYHLNLYSYADNNPVMYKDPFGEDKDKFTKKLFKELDKIIAEGGTLAKIAEALKKIICGDFKDKDKEALLKEFTKELFDRLMDKLGWGTQYSAFSLGLAIGGQFGQHIADCLQVAVDQKKCFVCYKAQGGGKSFPYYDVDNEIWCIQPQGKNLHACWIEYEYEASPELLIPFWNNWVVIRTLLNPIPVIRCKDCFQLDPGK